MEREIIYDARPLHKRLGLKRTVAYGCLGLAAASLILPAYAPVFLGFGAGAGLAALGEHCYNRWKKSGKNQKGIFFLGTDQQSGDDVWFSNDTIRQHMLVLGTTGSGKTEGLLGMLSNALSWGSGALFVDGKGDPAVFAKVYEMCRAYGREDDLLVLNFMMSNRASGTGHTSNSLNPFATGSADSLAQMVVSLMDDAGGDGAMWKGRATAMFTGVMRALVGLRDTGQINLDVGVIRDHLNLRKIIDFVDEGKYPGMSNATRQAIRSYLNSLPGFQGDRGYKQPQTTLDQHGYLEMQFCKILGSLADVYGHIFITPDAEVSMEDIVFNRRIVLVMLPSLEKSSDEIANLGRIVLASLKGMMGAALGSTIQGSWEDIVDRCPTNSRSPFVCILDEAGYYAIEGMALMAAQARSLGFSMVYASQDMSSMRRLCENEAASIVANTNTKIFMRVEEPESVRSALRGGVLLDTMDRVDFLDIRSQSAGEAVVVHQDNVRRVRLPDLPSLKRKPNLRLNAFVRLASARQSNIA